MNKQEAVSQIMEIKAVLPEHLQIKLIDAVKVLANFKAKRLKTSCYATLCLDFGQVYGLKCSTYSGGADNRLLYFIRLLLWKFTTRKCKSSEI